MIDPLSIALMGGTALAGLIGRSDSRRAERTAGQNTAFQQAMAEYIKRNIPVQERGLQYAMGAADEQREGLDETRDTADQGIAMALQGRTDAQGNRIEFVPGRGWVTTLGPQAAEASSRLYERSRMADQDFRDTRSDLGDVRAEALAQMRYGGGPSEDALQSEITGLIMQTLGSGDRALEELTGRQALRQQGNMPIIYHGRGSGGATEGAKRLAEAKLQARSQALQEMALRQQTGQQKYLPMLDRLEASSTDRFSRAGAASQAYATDPTVGRLSGDAGQMHQLALQMVQNKGNQIGQGYGRVLQGAGEVGNAYGRIGQAYGQLNPASANVNNASTSQVRATMGTADQMNNMARNMIAAGRPPAGRGVTNPVASSGTTYVNPQMPVSMPDYDNWYNW